MVRDDTARVLARRLGREQSESRLPSVAAGLVRDGKLTWFGGAGEVDGAPPTDETQYRCGSISKTFVAVEVMRLRDEGLVDLSDPITKHLPELGALRCDVAQLLSHTSGIRAETAGPWWERTPGIPFDSLVESSIRDADVLIRPGRRYHYSNVGFAILGELISRIRGRSWDDVVDDELLRPVGMLRTTTRPVRPYAPGYGVHPHADVVLGEPEHDAASMAPAGQLWTTTDDLSRWSSVLAGLRPEILSAEAAAEMREPLALNDMPGQAWASAHGLGLQLWNRAGARSYGHAGSMPGFLAILRIEEQGRDAVIILVNATSGLSPALESDLLAILAEHEPKDPPPWRPAPGGVAPEVREITGTWYWGTYDFILSVKGDGLLDLSPLGTGRPGTFRPAPDGTFVGLSDYYAYETLRTVRRADGTVSHLDIGSFVLTRSPYDAAADIPGGADEAGWTGSAAEPEHRHGLLGHTRRRE